jgi:hypothetical protein
VKVGSDPQEAAMIKGDINSASESTWGRLYSSPGVNSFSLTTTGEPVVHLKGEGTKFYLDVGEILQRRANGEHEAQPFVTISSVRRTMEIMEAALRSAKELQVVKV